MRTRTRRRWRSGAAGQTIEQSPSVQTISDQGKDDCDDPKDDEPLDAVGGGTLLDAVDGGAPLEAVDGDETKYGDRTGDRTGESHDDGPATLDYMPAARATQIDSPGGASYRTEVNSQLSWSGKVEAALAGRLAAGRQARRWEAGSPLGGGGGTEEAAAENSMDGESQAELGTGAQQPSRSTASASAGRAARQPQQVDRFSLSSSRTTTRTRRS